MQDRTFNSTGSNKVNTAIKQQVQWIEEHGGDAAGYLERYGSSGDGAAAIYTADKDQLDALRQKDTPTYIDPDGFALLMGITVEEATEVLEQERQELAATGNPDIHDGYDYRKQQWVTA